MPEISPATGKAVRFSLRTLLLGMSLVALVFVLAHYLYEDVCEELFGDYEPIAQRIKLVRGINNVFVAEIGQWNGTTIDAEMVTFQIDGRPNSRVSIYSPDFDMFTSANHICLGVISNMRVNTSHLDASGEHHGSGGVDIGPESDLKDVLPFTVKNINELIDRYDELEVYFKTWPEWPETRSHKVSSSFTLEYYINY
jgi:hypothetical protein